MILRRLNVSTSLKSFDVFCATGNHGNGNTKYKYPETFMQFLLCPSNVRCLNCKWDFKNMKDLMWGNLSLWFSLTLLTFDARIVLFGRLIGTLLLTDRQYAFFPLSYTALDFIIYLYYQIGVSRASANERHTQKAFKPSSLTHIQTCIPSYLKFISKCNWTNGN